MRKLILVVCHGNLFRSPACEAVLRAELPADRFTVSSAGFKPRGGKAAKRMRDAMARHGYSLEAHKPQLVTTEALEAAHMVVYMDGGNLCRLEAMNAPTPKLFCLAQTVNRPRIPDPNYIQDSVQFEAVVDLIVVASTRLAEQLRGAA